MTRVFFAIMMLPFSRSTSFRLANLSPRPLSMLRKTRSHFMTDVASAEETVFAASRLGLDPSQNRRHCPLVFHEDYSFADWPPSHTFPIDKFGRLGHAIRTTPQPMDGKPLVADTNHFFRPLEYNPTHLPRFLEWFCGPLDGDFVTRFLHSQLTSEEARIIGFREQTSRPELIRRTVLEVAGTVLTAQLACHYGIAANLAGGTHHAHSFMGAGYTILNDLVVAASVWTDPSNHRYLPFPVERVLVVDCDVHQGDGTARCMREVKGLDSKLFTLSLHCASNYPHPKAYSTYDVGLPDKMQDEAYLQVLEASVVRAVEEVQPDLVLYDAGVDIYQHDKLGRLHVSEEGIRKRDRWVVDFCVRMEIPIAAVIGGGYDKDVDALARRHAILHEECSAVWREYRMWERVQQ